MHILNDKVCFSCLSNFKFLNQMKENLVCDCVSFKFIVSGRGDRSD
jgi:hypothetical protein